MRTIRERALDGEAGKVPFVLLTDDSALFLLGSLFSLASGEKAELVEPGVPAVSA